MKRKREACSDDETYNYIYEPEAFFGDLEKVELEFNSIFVRDKRKRHMSGS